ncbi:MAG: ferredoxin family protein [Clostridiales Family XIII bacterium]|jgi:adenylylsulfate reductase subunit B|nr:ferredoxin family protein [Clostridiales Family XIII bacterium]
MSIEVDRAACTGCGRCADICPGSLLALDESGAAFIARPERCWGCASCVKECAAQAIALYLGEDIGGLGGRLTVRRDGPLLHWAVRLAGGETKVITVDGRDANRY